MKVGTTLMGLVGAIAGLSVGPGGIAPRPAGGYVRGASTLTGPERQDRKAKNKRAAKARKVSRRAR